jgi:trimethylamine--corrinoid protein Co-methyltransferase
LGAIWEFIAMPQIKPLIKAMNQEQVHKAHAQAVRLLETVGVLVVDPWAVDLFEKALARPAREGRVRIPEEMVDWAIDAVPSTIRIYDRLGSPAFTLTGDGEQEALFGVGVTNLHFREPGDGSIHPFNRKDMARAVGLGHSLDRFDLVSTPGVIQDVGPKESDLISMLEMLANTTKPLVVLISGEKAFGPALDMCEHLLGDLATQPCIIPYVNPITPLVLNAETTRKIRLTLERGLPLFFSNYGMSGATCPITPAGTLVLLLAELLAGLVFTQLVKQGASVILGSQPAAFDMKSAGSFYSPQSLLLNLACAEMMTHYGIPHGGTSGCANGWGADLMAGISMTINHFTSCLGNPGLVPFVGGSFDSLVFSPELVVYADDVIEQSRKFRQGFSLDEDSVGLDDIERIGPGGNFLLSSLTAKYFKDSQFSSGIWPFMSMEKWQNSGKPDARKFLSEKTRDILASPDPPEDKADILARGEVYLGSQ